MSNGCPAEHALKCVRLWYGSLPLLSTELLLRALEAKSGDYPEFPAALLAELCQRLWLFPPPVENIELWLERLGPGLKRSQFWARYAAWACNQANDRTYKIPDDIINSAHTELEKTTAEYMKNLFCKWHQSHGVIAFVRKGVEPEADAWENLPPMSDTLLPFRLVAVNLHEPEADYGMRAALDAMNRANNLVPYFLQFPTMHRLLPPWMVGESGALAIWYTMLARNRSLTCRALDIGLSGCLRKFDTSHLDPERNTADIIIRKRDLFRSARVPVVILPSTWNLGPPPRGFNYWPQSEPPRPRMEELLSWQVALHPDAKELKRIETCLVDGEDELNIAETLIILQEMEEKCTQYVNTAHQINLLAFVCCCRLQREPEATKREQRILQIPRDFLGDYSLNVRRSAYVAGAPAKPRLLGLAARLKTMAAIGE